MKKLFAALTLMMFVGSVSATVYAVASGNTIEIKNQDDKKKKKCKKGDEKSCSTDKKKEECKEGEKKKCCATKTTENK